MTPEQKADLKAVELAIKQIVEDELPKRLVLTSHQHEMLIALLEFAAMVASAKKFGVPLFNLVLTAIGIWFAVKQFILGSK
jgi:hypothetical protein